MNPVILAVLQRVMTRGVGREAWNHGPSQLPRWKRWINALLKRWGMPFYDAGRWKIKEIEYLSESEMDAINRFLFENTPQPKCRHCGSTNLDCDPRGYYCDAVDHRGAPLLCLDAENKTAHIHKGKR